MQGITKIGKREAYRRLKALGRRRTKRIKTFKRFYIFDREVLGINSWRGFDELVEQKLQTMNFQAFTDWKNSKEILVFADTRANRRVREFLKALSVMLEPVLK